MGSEMCIRDRANGGNSREEYFIEGTQPTQQAVHEVGTTIIDNGEAQELF